ncbi:MAG TPA: hypothetical protein VH062_14725 [Polyangiaceae bacterium]|jgi:hypothetical protein|nr:hypothetical protein [Polyangiaceae bacterium]
MTRVLGKALIPLLTLALSACVAVDHGKNGGSSGGSGGDGNSGTGGTGAGGKGSTDDGPPPTNTTPSLDVFDAHVTGRNGDDLTLSASGTDAEGDVLFLSARFLNDAGDPVDVFDVHWNGIADAPQDRLQFDTSLLGHPRFDGTVTLAGYATLYPEATSVVLHLEDTAGNVSDDQTVTIGLQTEKKLGESCDADIVTSRCERGLACGGKKPVCQAGVAPALVNALYMRSSDGPRLLAAGGDADDDIATLRMEFFDNAGTPVKIDLNGDQIPDATSWDLDAYGSSDHGAFFLKDQLGLGFEAISPRMKITPIDGEGKTGDPKSITIAAPLEQATLHACDPRGFDTCGTADLCAPGIVGVANSCTAATTVKKGVCAAAPVLDPAKSITTAYGRAQGISMWDPPAGCTQPGWIRRPEGMAKLHLATVAHHLTVTTALPETRSDTVVYLVQNTAADCGGTVTAKTVCNDDTRGYSSTITATEVPAGDYLVIVDSVSESGGAYGVTVTAD